MILRKSLKQLHREAEQFGEGYFIEVIAAGEVHPATVLIDEHVLGEIKARHFGNAAPPASRPS